MKKEKKSDLLPREEKRYQKPMIIELGKLREETKGSSVVPQYQDSGSSTVSAGG